MKKALLITLLTALFTLSCISARAGDVPNAKYMLENGNMGREFWVVIPQNDEKNAQIEKTLDIYVMSYTDTQVMMQAPNEGTTWFRDVKAFEPTIFTYENGTTNFGWEVHESEEVTDKGVHLTSDQPFAVYVLTARRYSSDGYLAVPVTGWGKEYYHCSYYDAREWNAGWTRNAGGFIVMANEDGTIVDIDLDGYEEGENCATYEGRKLGEHITATLKKGQTYMVRGNGQTSGSFDLTGTRISSTKPIGVVSYHMRTKLPVSCTEGRDHLCEMLLPTDKWGTEFVTVELPRDKDMGDYFRVVACQDNTTLTGEYFDPASGTKLGSINALLSKGDFYEFHPAKIISGSNTNKSIRGTAVWHSNNPVQLMQYSYSYSWDKANFWDPFMTYIPPVNQFVSSCMVQVAEKGDFKDNKITIIAKGNPDDEERKLINSVTFDGKKVLIYSSMFQHQRIPGTNYFWCTFKVDPGVHHIESDTKLFVSVAGLSNYNTYGWPAVMGTNLSEGYDTLAPKLSLKSANCGNFEFEVSDNYVAPAEDEPRQADLGIRDIFLLPDESENYEIIVKDYENIATGKGIYNTTFELKLLDPTKYGKAVFAALDQKGNFVMDSVRFENIDLVITPDTLHFAQKRAGNQYILPMQIVNNSSSTVTLSGIDLDDGSHFELLNKEQFMGHTMAPGNATDIELSFSPEGDAVGYNDAINFSTECFDFTAYLAGTSVLPAISTDDYSYNKIYSGDTTSLKTINGYGLKIENPGSDTLTVFELRGLEPPFSLSQETKPNLPTRIAPGDIIFLEDIFFMPTDSGDFSCELIISSDAMQGDSSVSLTGMADKEPISVSEIQKENNILFPNPATDIIYLREDLLNYKFSIIYLSSSNGSVIHLGSEQIKRNGNVLQIDTRLLPSGVYSLVLIGSTGAKTIRFAIVR